REGAIAKMREEHRRDPRVVVDDVALREPGLRVEDLVEVLEDEPAAPDLHLDVLRARGGALHAGLHDRFFLAAFFRPAVRAAAAGRWRRAPCAGRGRVRSGAESSPPRRRAAARLADSASA